MAAAHVSAYHPDADLVHIFDPRIPIIGVGEGTNPDFPPWLLGVTGLTHEDLVRECSVTMKYGIHYENWGRRTSKFVHNFYPIGQSAAYHLSASRLVDLLARFVRGTRLPQRVSALSSTGVDAKITLENGETIEADLVVDARGFPRSQDDETLTIDLIPTNAAFIRRGPVATFQSAMRNIARPHGWVFVVPLATDTAYGYVYNHNLSSKEEVSEDLGAVLAAERVQTKSEARSLTFPTFVRRRAFDGSLLRIGNTASFIEPLEATAIGLISQGLKAIDLIVKNAKLLGAGPEKRSGHLYQMLVTTINNTLFVNVWERALFVGWHYSMGSAFTSPFWDYAVQNYARQMERFHVEHTRKRFERFLEEGRRAVPEQYESFSSETFGGFPAASFAEIGRGIGYFAD
jgi:tryptophan halogenase